jgi:translation initiation factor 2B subunit (eIF-2B alpha/beta/delta family)
MQRLLDEKASRQAMQHKVNKGYVDDLFERIASSIKESLSQITGDNVKMLEDDVVEVHHKLIAVRKKMQDEINNIRFLINDLKTLMATEKSLIAESEEAQQEAPKKQTQFRTNSIKKFDD